MFDVDVVFVILALWCPTANDFRAIDCLRAMNTNYGAQAARDISFNGPVSFGESGDIEQGKIFWPNAVSLLLSKA